MTDLLQRDLTDPIIVDEKVLLELTSPNAVDKVHQAQLLKYLKLTGIKVGFLGNFHTHFIKDGITRRGL